MQREEEKYLKPPLDASPLLQVPSDIFLEIFSWLSPRQSLALRGISREFAVVLDSSAFAATSLSRWRTHVWRNRDPTRLHFRNYNEAWDILFFFPPVTSFPSVYAELVLKGCREIDLSPPRDPPGFHDERYLDAPLSTHVARLVHLKVLNLSCCGLKGELPGGLFRLTGLEMLRLHANGLTGAISPDVANMVGLVVLDLSINAFCGELPASIARMSRLQELDVCENELTGVVPKEVKEMGLVLLGVEGNQFDKQCD
ncbi:hypothetical protein BC830DRAFT_1085248 [Chytriomyces sp. MP71]|nr:hypothetical protein BC830DRAFT_1085248 [Chytriomyces sp. MP71]